MNSAGLIGKLPVLSAAIALAAVACAPARAQGSPDRSAAAAEMTVDAQGMSRRTVLETFFAGSGSTVAWVDEKAASEALYGVYKGRADMAILRRVLNGLNFVAIQPDASGGSPVFEIVVYGEAAARGAWNDEERAVADEFLAHARAIREERAAAAKAGREPDVLSLLRQWGGVTIAYRRRLIDSPSYTLNHEEVQKALEEGIWFAECLSPTAIDVDAGDRKSTRLNSSHIPLSRMPSSA
mgnify:CR=1 FL=1